MEKESFFKKASAPVIYAWSVLSIIVGIICATWYITLWINAKDNKDLELESRVIAIENEKLDLRVTRLEDTFKDFADTNKKLLAFLSKKESKEIDT